MNRARLAAAALICISACGSGEDGGPSQMTGELTYRPCADSERVGRFVVAIEAASASAFGQVGDVVNPLTLVKERTAGECRFFEREASFCSPTCGSSQHCALGGRCLPLPTNRSAGAVTISGLMAPATLMAGSTGRYTAMLPHPAVVEGADVRLQASGAAVPAFSLRGQGIVPIVAGAEKYNIEPGKPLRVTWTPGRAGAQRIVLKLTLNQHGVTPGWLECQAGDTGSYEIPAALITELRSKELSHGPSISIARQTADSTRVSGGCVDFLVQSETALEIVDPAIVKCKSPADCPTGKSCDVNNLICK
jgi:hypothetical protein